MSYWLMPYTYLENEGAWSLPDRFLSEIFMKLQKQDKIQKTWYDGSVQTEADFRAFLQGKGNFPVFVFDDQDRPVFLAWLNNLGPIFAQAHFCGIAPFRRGMAKAVLEYWFSMKGNGQPFLQLLIGVTPATHTEAIRLLKIVGFTVVGTIPKLCYIRSRDEFVPGVISYHENPSTRR